MKIGAIIFSRFSSERLPGKALIDISGRSFARQSNRSYSRNTGY